MMRLIYLTSIVVMAIMLLINVVTWRIAGNAPINVDDDVDHLNDDSSSMMKLSSKHNTQPQTKSSKKKKQGRRRLSSSIKERFRHRSLQLSKDSFMDGQLSVVASAPIPNENIHVASIQRNRNKNILNNLYQPKSSSNQYRPNYSTILSKHKNHTVRYIQDSLCSGCRYEYTPSNNANETTPTTCWYEIEELLNYDNVSIIEAATIVSELYPNNCQRCNPNSCTDNEKKYYRPDDMISQHDIGYARTHFLKSIDANDRVPFNILKSKDELNTFLQNPDNVYPHREYFVEFNPSITHLPKNQIPKQLLSLKGKDDNKYADSYYLVSFRVSNAHFCFKDHETTKIHNVHIKSFRSIDYLGIAILDIHLNILLETVVDIRSVVRSNIPELNNGDKLYQDGRLFTLNNQLYLGSYTMLYPIWLVPPMNYNSNSNSHRSPESEGEIVQMPYYMTAAKKRNKDYNENEYNTHLLNVYIQRSGYCSNDMNYQLHGKSYNYFYDSNKQRIVLEIFPMGLKEYIDTTNCQLSNKNIDFIITNKPIPMNSYSTTDEVVLSYKHGTIYPYHSDRGNHCCLSINVSEYYYPKYTNHTTLLSGISHITSKVMHTPLSINGATYFHSFYAMESIAPYNIVARSGRFCLGHSQHDGNDNNTNNEIHFTNPRREVPFKFGPESYDCPKIHFVTGMTEALHDPNQVIISYGIDDCYSRFITISKEHILSLLLFNNDNDQI